VAVLSPKSSTTYTNEDIADLQVRISDDVNPTLIRFRTKAPGARDYSPWIEENLGGRRTVKRWTRPVELLFEGVWTFQFLAFDASGNRSDVRTVKIVADRSRPVVSITSDAISRSSSYSLAATITDAYRPAQVEYRVKEPRGASFGGWNASRLSGVNKKQNWSDTLALGRRGTWEIQVRAFDAAGNVSRARTINVNRR
jgi:hypothetical protein